LAHRGERSSMQREKSPARYKKVRGGVYLLSKVSVIESGPPPRKKGTSHATLKTFAKRVRKKNSDLRTRGAKATSTTIEKKAFGGMPKTMGGKPLRVFEMGFFTQLIKKKRDAKWEDFQIKKKGRSG